MTSREFILNAIRSHKSELAKFGISTIGLFGSYVRGEASEDSDIDILIEFTPENESFDNFMAAYDYFEELFKNEKVELVTKKGLSPYIGPAILNEVVYA
jgi:predicted nucleotidyltransferase